MVTRGSAARAALAVLITVVAVVLPIVAAIDGHYEPLIGAGMALVIVPPLFWLVWAATDE